MAPEPPRVALTSLTLALDPGAFSGQGATMQGCSDKDLGLFPELRDNPPSMTESPLHRTRIKICGLTREADVDAAVEAGADAIGFVLYEKSPRHVLAQRAGQLAARLPAFVTPVVLLVNATDALLAQALEAVPNALLQFHGDESVSDCQRWGRPYLRAARMGAGFDLLDFARAHAAAQAVLADALVEGYGGGGHVFDWRLIPDDLPGRLILSGGLHAGNVGEGIRRLRPWAVDVSSGVEVAKGIKDAVKMREFCQAVRAADLQCAGAT